MNYKYFIDEISYSNMFPERDQNIDDWQDIRLPTDYLINLKPSSVLGSIYNRLSLNLEENSTYESWNIASYFDIS